MPPPAGMNYDILSYDSKTRERPPSMRLRELAIQPAAVQCKLIQECHYRPSDQPARTCRSKRESTSQRKDKLILYTVVTPAGRRKASRAQFLPPEGREGPRRAHRASRAHKVSDSISRVSILLIPLLPY